MACMAALLSSPSYPHRQPCAAECPGLNCIKLLARTPARLAHTMFYDSPLRRAGPCMPHLAPTTLLADSTLHDSL